MIISISDNTKKALTTLNLQWPFSNQDLKKNYRALLMEVHPDRNNGNGKERAIQIIKAYNILKNLAIDCLSSKPKEEKEGDIFADVYKEKCDICKGTGHKIEMSSPKYCHNCSSMFFVGMLKKKYQSRKCYDCRGTGIFELKSGRKVECRKCEGTGHFFPKCHICDNKRILQGGENIKIKCWNCKGKGYTKIDPFNPVIPRGAVL